MLNVCYRCYDLRLRSSFIKDWIEWKVDGGGCILSFGFELNNLQIHKVCVDATALFRNLFALTVGPSF